MKMLESEKHRRWSMQVEGLRGQVATDGFLIRKTGKWRACGWAVVQLDCDGEMVPLSAMYGSMEAEFEVQRIKRAELTAFLCLLKKVIVPIKVHVDNKGIIDELRKEEKECSRPRVGDADLLIKCGRNRMVCQNEASWWKWNM